MCIIAVNTCSFVFDSVSDRYKTKEMCDKAVDDCLTALKFVHDWFVTSKTIKKLFTDLYTDENILYFKTIKVMPHLIIMKWVFLI